MEKIRITSGEYRGQSIQSPGSTHTHPMGSREKLALFNMISDYLPGAVVLDAFAGSGALGIEALSRGASRVVFVEKNPRIAEIIRGNIDGLQLAGQAHVQTCSVGTIKTNDAFDIIIADPPYDNFDIENIRSLVKFLKKDGIFVLSHPENAPDIEDLTLIQTKKYAKARISIYRATKDS